jgi:hypothetical protein
MTPAVQLLINKGRLRVVKQEARAYIRIDLYTSNTEELDLLQEAFGGRTALQEHTVRWGTQAEHSLLLVGKELYDIGHPAGNILLAYVNARSGPPRWALAMRYQGTTPLSFWSSLG